MKISSNIGISSPPGWEGPGLLFRVRGEAQRAESGGGVLGEGQPAPSIPPARWSGGAGVLPDTPEWGSGGAPAAKNFLVF